MRVTKLYNYMYICLLILYKYTCIHTYIKYHVSNTKLAIWSAGQSVLNEWLLSNSILDCQEVENNRMLWCAGQLCISYSTGTRDLCDILHQSSRALCPEG